MAERPRDQKSTPPHGFDTPRTLKEAFAAQDRPARPEKAQRKRVLDGVFLDDRPLQNNPRVIGLAFPTIRFSGRTNGKIKL
jgi:hypothetical protein